MNKNNNNKFLIRCAVHALILKNEKILLYRRVNTNWQDGKYGMPGGHLEAGETVLQATVREIKEESGLDVKPEDLVLVHTSHRYYDPGKSIETNHDYIDLFFKVTSWTGDPIITSENKSDEMKWVDIRGLPENTLGYEKSMIENYLNGKYYSEFSS